MASRSAQGETAVRWQCTTPRVVSLPIGGLAGLTRRHLHERVCSPHFRRPLLPGRVRMDVSCEIHGVVEHTADHDHLIVDAVDEKMPWVLDWISL